MALSWNEIKRRGMDFSREWEEGAGCWTLGFG